MLTYFCPYSSQSKAGLKYLLQGHKPLIFANTVLSNFPCCHDMLTWDETCSEILTGDGHNTEMLTCDGTCTEMHLCNVTCKGMVICEQDLCRNADL